MSDVQTETVVSDVEDALARETGEIRLAGHAHKISVLLLASWSLFQLYLASGLGPIISGYIGFGIINDIYARAAHLGFGATLCFLMFAGGKTAAGARKVPWYDYIIAALAVLACVWQAVYFAEIIGTAGTTRPMNFLGLGSIPFEFILGWVAILIVLEAARRAVGLPLAIIGAIFIAYSLYNQYLPDPFALSRMSYTRFVTAQWFGQEGIFGIPIGVSVKTIFLFVLFGALLDKGGAGKWFIDIAFACVGHLRGGPAKSAVLASGMTGMISGSSIANTVTTGTFTIPIMRQNGYPAVKAGAIEVASSVNGQLMPPIMGAAAFVMAEILGISYFEVVKHAFIPAIISYIALFYIVHLEAVKLDLTPAERVERAWTVFKRGWHYLIPIVVLIYSLVVLLNSPDRAAFYCILTLFVVFFTERLMAAASSGEGNAILTSVRQTGGVIWQGLLAGAKNMISVSIAVAAAGLVMGSIGSSGLSNALQEILSAIAGENIFPILIATAVLSIILGMGLPTTANYLIVSTLMVGIVASLGRQAGFDFPLVAIHLFCFYFGLMADVTPPVGLAAFAAASISRADPIKTGFQAFWYSSRTAILPFVFLFNSELLLIGVETIQQGVLVFVMSLLAVLAFTALTQGYMRVRLNIIEFVLLIAATAILFRPGMLQNWITPEEREPVTLEQFEAGIEAPIVNIRTVNVLDEEATISLTRDMVEGAPLSWQTLGVAANPSFLHEGGIQVTLREFNGAGAKAGLANAMTIIEASTVKPRMSKYWYYIPGVLLLLGVYLWQGQRLPPRAPKKQAAPA